MYKKTQKNSKKKNTSKKTLANHKIWSKDILLSVTISPSIKDQYFTTKQVIANKAFPEGVVCNAKVKTYTGRKGCFLKSWYKKFSLLALEKASQNYYFFYEISHNGLMHWHGTVQVDNPDELTHWIGSLKYNDKINIDIDTIDDHQTWFNYCSKDYDINKYYQSSLITNDKTHCYLKEFQKSLTKDPDSKTTLNQ